MQPESRKYLYDIRAAAERIATFTKGRDVQGFAKDELLRSGVERQFEIIGEALAQLARRDPGLAERISEHARIIAFRNILIHGYAEVDPRIVWDIVTSKLPTLRAEVERLTSEPD
ncbi:MAG: hypothetical protein B7Z68_09715 [Acidobacteria bacterium 21-70-11]|nr:MAG: hypothetical protein B7Z68_09715 [Acidobacteria bacterium 21-70-11]OYW05045.1 MAG: hypothetical protein B7Z61_07625 [Acidobacteria bacterium 37-71-11]HQT94811.1 DUF86 domain-containing protein [Thermoanaerobaculaceae bacterium]HQU33929.1 DUF86 domain-containing protein [Thermoanaerobaculaceae bacterium]